MRNPTFVGHKVKHYPHLWLKVKTRWLPTHADGVSHLKIGHFALISDLDQGLATHPDLGTYLKKQGRASLLGLVFESYFLGTVLTHVVIFQANCFA
jgi:hypothetical protein